MTSRRVEVNGREVDVFLLTKGDKFTAMATCGDEDFFYCGEFNLMDSKDVEHLVAVRAEKDWRSKRG